MSKTPTLTNVQRLVLELVRAGVPRVEIARRLKMGEPVIGHVKSALAAMGLITLRAKQRAVTPAIRHEVLRLIVDVGLTPKEIAARMNLDVARVYYIADGARRLEAQKEEGAGVIDTSGARCRCGLRLPCNNCLPRSAAELAESRRGPHFSDTWGSGGYQHHGEHRPARMARGRVA